MHHRLANVFARYCLLVLTAIAWEVSPRIGLTNPQFLPPLSIVCATLFRLAQRGELASHLVVSSFRMLASFGLAFVIALPAGIVLGYFAPHFERVVHPL
jgi:NitT/TauT family transport system permease protein